MSINDTLDYCDKSNDHSFLNSTNCSVPNNVSISTVTTATGCPINVKAMSTTSEEQHRRKKSHIHFNRLWSVWYGILVTILQGYLVILGLQKYLGEKESISSSSTQFIAIVISFLYLCD